MKVLIAPGTPDVADSLIPLMRVVPKVELLSPTKDAETTLESIRAHDPEVLILNAGLPGAKEIDLLQTIRAEKPGATLIILTDLTYPEFQKRLTVWEDFVSLGDPKRVYPLSELDAVGEQIGGVWVKFSCGELGLLHWSDDTVFDVVATAL
jgi:hypothetical protein